MYIHTCSRKGAPSETGSSIPGPPTRGCSDLRFNVLTSTISPYWYDIVESISLFGILRSGNICYMNLSNPKPINYKHCPEGGIIFPYLQFSRAKGVRTSHLQSSGMRVEEIPPSQPGVSGFNISAVTQITYLNIYMKLSKYIVCLECYGLAISITICIRRVPNPEITTTAPHKINNPTKQTKTNQSKGTKRAMPELAAIDPLRRVTPYPERL